MSRTLRLSDVTMLEAIEALRKEGLWVQFEREPLDEGNVDRTRPVIDSTHRFNAEVSLEAPPMTIVGGVVAADGSYDHLRLTESPLSMFVFPRSTSSDRFARCVLAQTTAPLDTARRPLSEVVAGLLEPIGVSVFDRARVLDRVTEPPEVPAGGRRLFVVLGELCAASGQPIVWTLGGFARARVFATSLLAPPSIRETGA